MINKLCKLIGILAIFPLILTLSSANASQIVISKNQLASATPAQVMILAKGQNHLPEKPDKCICEC